MSVSLIVLGIPSKTWFEPARIFAETRNHGAQTRFQKSLSTHFDMSPEDAGSPRRPISGNLPADILALLTGFPERENAIGPGILTDPRACWLGSAMATAATKARFLAFYTSPEDFLAGLDAGSDPAQGLETWIVTSRYLLDMVRAHRGRVSLLSVEECLAAPEAWQGFLSETFGLKPWEMPHPAEADPVRLALAKMQALSNPQVGMVLAELDAASHPLAGDAPPRHTLSLALAQAWRHLATHEGLLKNLRESQEENHLLLQQLHQVQQELETLFLENKKLIAQADQKNQADLKESQARHKEAQEENHLLLQQLHQVQEELERFYFENKALEAAQRSAGSAEARHLQSQGLVPGASRENTPHSHLDFSLTGVRLGERELGTLRLRLVEHHGRPGLVVIHHSGSAPLLHWQSNGEEGGVPFLLVVPQDDSGRKILAAAPASDLILLAGSVRMLAAELENPGKQGIAPGIRPWARVARRFLDEVRDAPARIHYDDLDAVRKDNQSLHFALRHPWTPCKGLLGGLDFGWKDHSLTFSLPKDTSAPLTRWPAGEDGKALSELALDLNPRGEWKVQRRAWAELTASDRELILLLVAELPNLIHHLYEKNPALSILREDLTTRAQAMMRQAQALATGRKRRWFDFAR
jgi:hypothetical protein